ncbi:MAG: MetQ/NlpA family ABC transporter substrate-binding protein, partial [Hydrogenoanaerobacterium sp.]
SLADVDVAVINGNYALQAGFNASTDALAVESKESESTKAYVNVLAVRKGDENREDLKALVAALKSDEVKKFIEETYKGAVVPMF